MPEPLEPVEPKPSDFPKEPGFSNEKTPFIVAYRKYQRDHTKYLIELETYQQMKMIKDIRRSSDKLVLKKYFIKKV